MKITPELVRKYLNNKCTPEEREAVDEWYNSFDNHPDPLRFLDKAEQEKLRRSLYERFKDSLVNKNGGNGHANNRFYLLIGALTGMAALMLLFVKLNTVKDRSSLAISSGDAITQVTVRNNSYSIYKKVLPDNSIVWLSPQSAITYPNKFKGDKRLVKLTGEAFFEVTKDKAHPFIIDSHELITKVWGTSFRIRAVNDMPAEVSVLTGKVSVHQNDNLAEIMLLPDQKVTLIDHKKLVKRSVPATATEMRIWKKVSLSFDDTRMSDVFTALNSKFHINIYSKDAQLNDLIFTADLTDQSLPAILDMIKTSVNASYAIEDENTFVFTTNATL